MFIYPDNPAACRNRRRVCGFTLVELLIVIGIIGVLVAILVPVISQMRVTGQSTDTAALVRALSNAADQYKTDLGKYPGIFPEEMLGVSPAVPLEAEGSPVPVSSSAPNVFVEMPDELEMVTGTENLLLSLMGGLIRNPNGEIIYDPAAVGRGPVSLRPGDSQTYSPFVEVRDEDTSMHVAGDSDVSYAALSSGDIGKRWGRFVEPVGAAQDSIVPEFVDRFSSPMPILYMRANTRVPRVGSPNYRIAGFYPTSPTDPRSVYYLDQVIGYTDLQGTYYVGAGRSEVNDMHADLLSYHGLREGRDANEENGFSAIDGVYTYMSTDFNMSDGPFDGIPYLTDASSQDVDDDGFADSARKADSYVIISAGPDRVYGTRDDITSFGKVVE